MIWVLLAITNNQAFTDFLGHPRGKKLMKNKKQWSFYFSVSWLQNGVLLRRRWTTLSWRDSAIACQHSCWRSCFSTSWLCCLQKFECFILGLEHRCPLTVKAKQAESTKSAAPRQCKKALALSKLLLGNPGKYFSTGTCFWTTMTSLSSCTGSGALNMRLVASDLFCCTWTSPQNKRDM